MITENQTFFSNDSYFHNFNLLIKIKAIENRKINNN